MNFFAAQLLFVRLHEITSDFCIPGTALKGNNVIIEFLLTG